MSKIFSKHLFEIRYKPNAKMLDKRGQITEALFESSGKIFKDWKISSNRVDFFSDDNIKAMAFFGFRNLGLAFESLNEKENFVKYTHDFVSAAWNFLEAKNLLRIGVRTSLLMEDDISFEKIFKIYKEKILKIDDKFLSDMGGELIDLGVPLNFKDGDHFFNLMTGPMKKNQSSEFFEGSKDMPETGIFLDIDYYAENFKPDKLKNIFEFINKGVEKAENILAYINNLSKEK